MTAINQTINYRSSATHATHDSVTELSEESYTQMTRSILEQGVSKSQSKDYVTQKLFEHFQENIDLSRKYKMPEEFQSIKKSLVEPYFCGSGHCEPKATKKDSSAWDKKIDCFQEKSSFILSQGISCATSLSSIAGVATVALASATCGSFFSDVIECALAE